MILVKLIVLAKWCFYASFISLSYLYALKHPVFLSWIIAFNISRCIYFKKSYVHHFCGL